MKRLIAVLMCACAVAGCEKPHDYYTDGYEAAVDSVRRVSIGSDITRFYDAMGVRYVIAVYQEGDTLTKIHVNPSARKAVR